MNALSTRFDMDIKRDGFEWHQSFVDGGHPVLPLAKGKKSDGHGTSIRFWLDRSIFKIEEGEPVPEFDAETIKKSLATRANLNPGLSIVFKDEKTGEEKNWLAESFAEILDAIHTLQSSCQSSAVKSFESGSVPRISELVRTESDGLGDVEILYRHFM